MSVDPVTADPVAELSVTDEAVAASAEAVELAAAASVDVAAAASEDTASEVDAPVAAIR